MPARAAMNRFLHPSASTFVANGRVNLGGRKLPFAVDIENGFTLRCTNAAGFRFVCCIVPDGASATECVLADGTEIHVRLVVNYRNGTVRVDATDGDYAWFWLEVRPNGLA